MKRKYLIIGLMILTVVSLGCTDKDMPSIINSVPEIQQYLKEHPNAKITTTYWTKDEILKLSDEINSQCGKTIIPSDMYKMTIQEENLKIISWIKANNQTLVCSFTEGDNTRISTDRDTDTNTLVIPTTVKIIENDSEDNKFLSFTKEFIDTISKDMDMVPSSDLPKDDYFKELYIYGQLLENDADKYLIKIEEYSVSSRMTYVYDRYKLYLKYIKLAGGYCKLATKYYDIGDIRGATRNLNKCTENINEATRNLNLATIYLRPAT